MKKTLLTAAFAALALGAAQAVAWSWTSTPETGYGTASGAPAVSAWDGTSGGMVTYAAKMTFGSSVTGSTVILELSNSQVGSASGAGSTTNINGFRVSLNDDGSLTLSVSNTNGTEWSTAATDTTTDVSVLNGTHAIGVAFNNAAGNSLATAKLYLDGVEVASTQVSGHFWKATLDTLKFGAEDVTSNVELAAYNGILEASDVTVQTVPEPTALALLALGVAGIALRRRAA